MSNEIIFLSCILIDIIFIFAFARYKAEWLFGIISFNLVLAQIFGAKLISLFGIAANAGNAFYAAAFLGTHFFLEKRGRTEGIKLVWFGFLIVVLFGIMSELCTLLVGLPTSGVVNASVETLFSFSPRATFGSLVAYVFAQHVNIALYEWIRMKTNGGHLWMRSMGANLVSQLLDSMMFFSIAFFNLPGPLLVQAILFAWAIKTAAVGLGLPFLYLDSFLSKKYPR